MALECLWYDEFWIHCCCHETDPIFDFPDIYINWGYENTRMNVSLLFLTMRRIFSVLYWICVLHFVDHHVNVIYCDVLPDVPIHRYNLSLRVLVRPRIYSIERCCRCSCFCFCFRSPPLSSLMYWVFVRVPNELANPLLIWPFFFCAFGYAVLCASAKISFPINLSVITVFPNKFDV